MRTLATLATVFGSLFGFPGTSHAAAGTCASPLMNVALAYAGWAPQDIPRANRIMWRESRCNAHARSRTHDSGLMQINDIHLRWLGTTSEGLMDPFKNLQAAHKVFARQGWAAWGFKG